MRSKLTIFGLVALGVALIVTAGCLSNPSGSTFQNGAPPGKVESVVFDTVTNVITKTNTVQQVVPVYATNIVMVPVTNAQNQVVETPEEVRSLQGLVTNLVQQLQQVTNYSHTVKDSVKADAQAGAAAVNAFAPGMGNIAYAGVMAVLGFVAWFRSSKQASVNGQTNTALVQEIETIKELVGVLPNGAALVQKIEDYLQAHQTEAGVGQAVLKVIQADLSNPDAKIAAQSILDSFNALSSTTAKLPNVSLTS